MTQKISTPPIVKGIVAILLLLCLIDADYGFYQAMRILISFGFAFLTYRYFQSGDKKNAVTFLCLLIIFQPLMKVNLGRGVWIVVDIIVAGFLIYQVIAEINSKNKPSTKNKIGAPKSPDKCEFMSDVNRISEKW